jgi:hypothetical protein
MHTRIVLNESIAGARVGDTMARDRALFGRAVAAVSVHFPGIGQDQIWLTFRNRIRIAYPRIGSRARAVDITTFNPLHRTSRGIHVGSTLRQILAAYPRLRLPPPEGSRDVREAGWMCDGTEYGDETAADGNDPNYEPRCVIVGAFGTVGRGTYFIFESPGARIDNPASRITEISLGGHAYNCEPGVGCRFRSVPSFR